MPSTTILITVRPALLPAGRTGFRRVNLNVRAGCTGFGANRKRVEAIRDAQATAPLPAEGSCR